MDTVAPLSDPLRRVEGLRGLTFEHREWQGTRRRDIGLAVSDVEAVCPEAIVVKDGQRIVDLARLVPLLVEAVKTLRGRLHQLEVAVHGPCRAGQLDANAVVRQT